MLKYKRGVHARGTGDAMATTYYTIQRDTETGDYYVTDGIWESAQYSRAYAKKVLADALWGNRGADGFGTYVSHRTR